MGGAKDGFGRKRLALVGELNPSRTLEAILFQKRVLAKLSELVDGLKHRRAISEITKSHEKTLTARQSA